MQSVNSAATSIRKHPMHDLAAHELWQLFLHFLSLSLLAVGGAITTTPDMHRTLVLEKAWMSETQFNDAIALAQAAPGPNVLFVAVMGWNVAGVWGVVAAMGGILLPSTCLALWASRWQGAHRQHPAVLVFTSGMAPITIGLLFATSWLLMEPVLRGLWSLPHQTFDTTTQAGISALLFVVTIVATVWRKVGPLALIGLGAFVGALMTLPIKSLV
jgi:chromate transporter